MKRIQALVGGPEKYETRRRKRRRGMSRKGVHRAASTDPIGVELRFDGLVIGEIG